MSRPRADPWHAAPDVAAMCTACGVQYSGDDDVKLRVYFRGDRSVTSLLEKKLEVHVPNMRLKLEAVGFGDDVFYPCKGVMWSTTLRRTAARFRLSGKSGDEMLYLHLATQSLR